MISLPGDRPIYLYMEPTDMRKSFRGLCALVYQHRGSPDDGGYYVFINRPRTHVKIMFWDGDGMAMFYKRLSKGTFVMPQQQGAKVCLDRRQLTLLLEGVVPLKTKLRFSRKQSCFEVKISGFMLYLFMDKLKHISLNFDGPPSGREAALMFVIEEQKNTISSLTETIAKFEHNMAILQKALFGPKSERVIDPDERQGEFTDLLKEADALAAANSGIEPGEAKENQSPDLPAKRRKRRSLPELLPSDLPREEVYIDLAEEQKVIEAVEIIIIDEISMVRADLFWAIDAILKRFAKGRNKKASMGGRQIIVCGDFLQLPPFAREPEVTEYIKSEFGGLHAFCSGAWDEAKFVYCNLKHVYRQQDHQMQNILNVLRHCQLWPQKDEAPPLSVLNQNCCWSDGIPPRDATYLCTVNRIADAINQTRLDDLPGSCMTFKGRISHKFPINELPVEFCLKIKKGARVMLRANSYFERIGGYEFVNGDTGTVEGFDNNIPQMPRVSVRLDNDRVVSVPPNIWKYYQYELEKGENGKHRITQVEAGKFVQLPLSPAWAISIHKSQGLTLPQVHLILGNSGCFCPGQLYTALSRVPSMDRLTIDRPIRKEDVIVDQAALAFYDRLDLGLQ